MSNPLLQAATPQKAIENIKKYCNNRPGFYSVKYEGLWHENRRFIGQYASSGIIPAFDAVIEGINFSNVTPMEVKEIKENFFNKSIK
jgi:hypothetical protein